MITRGKLFASYALWSCCWEVLEQPVVTTLATIKQHWTGGVSGLPRGIEDAITSIRKLGLRYLSVDALYIIQDSESDKTREIAQIGDIHENTNATTVAASAASCLDRFL
ncbi:hypothetical protein MFIFM68171_08198 [Madurella fahalii]|uniref:Heterokaryon incompatibility domain-containing protein n=1 Tax=Madurella fahalii TaxID=1157608 RepID=A0ABQ0GJS0_9PEZI